MAKIIVSEFVTLDGVVESPEKWSLAYWNAYELASARQMKQAVLLVYRSKTNVAAKAA